MTVGSSRKVRTILSERVFRPKLPDFPVNGPTKALLKPCNFGCDMLCIVQYFRSCTGDSISGISSLHQVGQLLGEIKRSSSGEPQKAKVGAPLP